MKRKPLLMAAIGMGLLAAGAGAQAHQPDHGHERVTPLMQQPLPDVAGKKVVLVTVNYAPGQASEAHVHPGSVFAYVLEGEVVSQLEGRAPVHYRSGQSWYEPPRAPHLVSKNASATAPARLLVWLLVDEGAALKQPLRK